MEYPVDLLRDGDTILVNFPDIPAAHTFGDDEADALLRARDALETAIIVYISDRRPLPKPSPADGRPSVRPSLLGEMKATVYTAMLERDWRKADLARALGVDARQIDRLLDLRHQTPAAHIERALRALGKEPVFDAREAA